jgi:aspartokinase
METIAVYWEPLIKTYGLVERCGLCLVSYDMCAVQKNPLHGPVDQANNVVLVVAQPTGAKKLRIHLLLNNKPSDKNMLALMGETGGDPMAIRVTSPVDMIFFQGPHYGDRYGIADAAFNALLLKQVPVLVASCCGSSIYLVIPAGQTRAAVKALSEKFVVPKAEKAK